MHLWALQHNKAGMTTEDNSGWWSDPLHGEEKPFHNIQPSGEHSPGGRHVTVKVYNQEKTSQEQIQEGSPEGAYKAWLDFAKPRPRLQKHSLDGWN